LLDIKALSETAGLFLCKNQSAKLRNPPAADGFFTKRINRLSLKRKRDRILEEHRTSNGNFREEHSSVVCEMSKLSGKWRLFNAEK
jgi:hypothetical protein